MKITKFNIFLAILLAVIVFAAGSSYYGSQPATPADIAAVIAKLEPQQKERFTSYLSRSLTFAPAGRMGKPLTRSEVSWAEDYARTADTEDQLRDAQQRALATTLPRK